MLNVSREVGMVDVVGYSGECSSIELGYVTAWKTYFSGTVADPAQRGSESVALPVKMASFFGALEH